MTQFSVLYIVETKDIQSKMSNYIYKLLKCIEVTILIFGLSIIVGCSSNEYVKPKNPINDPFEKSNRKFHKLNKNIDQIVLRPVSEIYGATIPQQVRLSAANFYSNLQEPKRFVNHVLQRKLYESGVDISRFALNSSVGVLGLFDIASWINLFPEETNFDATFGYFQIPPGPYLEGPIIGPSSLRDSVGIMADYTFNPLLIFSGPIQSVSFLTFEAVNIINNRYEYSNTIDILLYQSSDSYASTRLAYFQKLREKNIKYSKDQIVKDLFDPSADY